MSKKKNLFEENYGKWDSVNSTYKWHIHLANGKILTGYSKGLNVPEIIDKDTLLQKNIVRLFNNGYLNPKNMYQRKRTEKIDFFMNQEFADNPFLTLYQTTYESIDYQNDNTISFLERFYTMIESGKEVRNLVKTARKDFIPPDDLSRPRFSTPQRLQNFCNEMVRKGVWNKGRAKAFFHAYKEKFFHEQT